MATKTVKTIKARPERNKSTFVATVETAKQQLTKKTDQFFSISTQQTVVPENCKNSQKKFNESK